MVLGGFEYNLRLVELNIFDVEWRNHKFLSFLTFGSRLFSHQVDKIGKDEVQPFITFTPFYKLRVQHHQVIFNCIEIHQQPRTQNM